MNLRYFKEGYLVKLKKDIILNKSTYCKDKVWLNDYFEDEKWNLKSKYIFSDIELYPPQDNKLFDILNTKILYENMKELKPSQAADERIWTYLTHVTFWKYMRERWPAERYSKKNDDRFKNNILDRYFMRGNRSLIRNGISRLWWAGYISYNNELHDPFKLTKILLKKQDIFESIMGRNFSNNKRVTLSILSVLNDYYEINNKLPKQERIRNLCKELSFKGVVNIIDSLNDNEIKNLINKTLLDN